MRVTLERQKKDSKRFNIFLDGSFAFGADEDLIVNLRLLPGKEISTSDLERLLYEAEIEKLMERMYRLFGIRMRSEREVSDYFRKLNFKRKAEDGDQISDLVIDQLIKRLITKELINDNLFARAWIDSRRRSKKLGPRALKAELVKKGISTETIDQLLSDEQSDEQLALEALEKKLKAWKSLTPTEFRKKATDYLLRKGFDYSLIKKVIKI